MFLFSNNINIESNTVPEDAVRILTNVELKKKKNHEAI